jgi:hypothetical protein
MRQAHFCTTMNVNGDIVTDEMSTAASEVVELALSRRCTAGSPRNSLRNVSSEGIESQQQRIKRTYKSTDDTQSP